MSKKKTGMTWFWRWVNYLATGREHRNTIKQLNELSDKELADLGLSRADIDLHNLWIGEDCKGRRVMSDYIEYTVRVYENGNMEWRLNGKLHRVDGPAVERAYGSYRAWYIDDRLHREDGPAIEYADGTKSWWLHGILHRKDGPAVEYANGRKEWWLHGKLHRKDGPAVEYANGRKEWWLHNGKLTEEEFIARTSPAKELTVADIEKLLGHKVKIVKGEE